MCAHWPIAEGKTIHFRGRDRQLYSRTIVDSMQVMDSDGTATDISIGLLSDSLPTQVSIAKVFPSGIDMKISTGKALPVMQINQFKEGLVNEFRGYFSVEDGGCMFCESRIECRSALTGPLVRYDSGSPSFAIVEGTPVLIGTHYKDTFDPSVCAHADQVQMVMDTLLPGNTNVLQTIDILNYPNLPNGGY